MEDMDMLRNLVQQSQEELPFRPDRRRRKVELKLLPNTVFREPEQFLQFCRQYGRDYLRALFQFCYDKLTDPFSGEYVQFREQDFALEQRELGESRFLLLIRLPQPPPACTEYCTGLVLTWRQTGEKPEDLQLYTLEDSLYGMQYVGRIQADGSHTRAASSHGSLQEDLKTIESLAFPQ